MSRLNTILQHNEQFVSQKEYEDYKTTKFPNKEIVVLSCMDTRLGQLLPRAMDLKNGDAKIIKTAGAIVSHRFGSIMRSLLVAVYELNASEVYVVGHHDCGMTGLLPDSILEKARQRGVSQDTINTLTDAGIEVSDWLTGFENPEVSVIQSVERIKSHPLFPKDVPVHGLIIHPNTGKLDVVVDGYK